MKFNYQQMEENAQAIHNIALELKTIMDELQEKSSIIASHSNWDGIASDFFSNHFAGVVAQFDKVYEGVERSASYLDETIASKKLLESTLEKASSEAIQIS